MKAQPVPATNTNPGMFNIVRIADNPERYTEPSKGCSLSHLRNIIISSSIYQRYINIAVASNPTATKARYLL